MLIEYRFRIRNAANTADILTVSTVRGDTLPYLENPPRVGGSSINPLTGAVVSGSVSGVIIDAITSGTDRVVTSQLEDAAGRLQLGLRWAYWDYRIDGGSWNVLSGGLLTRYELVDDLRWDVETSDPTETQQDYTAFAPKEGAVIVSSNASIGATSVAVQALPFAVLSGTTLRFSSATFATATLSANAAAGATSISVAALAVALSTGDSAQTTETLSDYLARWPQRGCVFGGPVRGDFLTQKDRGGWEMQVAEHDIDTWLKFKAGYGPPAFQRTTRPRDHADVANAKVDDRWIGTFGSSTFSALDRYRTVGETRLPGGLWMGVVIEVIGQGFFAPTSRILFNGRTNLGHDGRYRQMVKGDIVPGVFITGTALSTGGSTVRVRCFTAEPSEVSPIYWTGHPVDLETLLWAEAGMAYNAATGPSDPITLCKAALGTDLRISIRVTEKQNLKEFLERVVNGPFGISVRVNAAGELEPFASRVIPASLPAVTLTDADVIPGTTRACQVSTSTAIRKLVFTHRRLVATTDMQFRQDSSGASSQTDGFISQGERFERTNGDPGAIGRGEQAYDVPGMVHWKDATLAGASLFVDALARTIFDRWGRGLRGGRTTAIRGAAGDGVALGQEILINVKQLPNRNKRIGDDASVGARAMQILQLTPIVSGYELELADSGPNATPVATVPTHTIAAAADSPRTVAALTITNAATLNSAGLAVRLQIAVTTGGAPAADAYTDVAAYEAGKVPTSAIRLPPVMSGRTVYVRGRSEQIDKRPSSWQTAVSVTLSVVNPPTSLSATPDGTDGSKCALAWTIGSGTDAYAEVDVYLRVSGAPSSDAIRQKTLPPGSNRHTLEDLTPGVSYTAGVQHRDTATGDVSAMTEVTFTAGATTVTLTAPVAQVGYAGSVDPVTGVPQRDGVYGLAVAATVIPGFVEFWEALETGVGAGTYGSYALIATEPSVQGNWTKCRMVAPNDGLRRSLKARHVRDGATESSYCTAVVVTPWTPLSLPAIPLPTLALSPTPGVPNYSIAFVSNGVVEHKTDAGVFGASTSPVVVARNAAGGADKVITFRATLAGQVTERTVSVPPLNIEYDRCVPNIASSDVDEIVVEVTSLAGGQVRLIDYTNAAGPTSGAAVGVLVASGSTWTFPRNGFQVGAGSATFEAVTSGFISDADVIVLPEQGRDTVALVVHADNLPGAPAGKIWQRVNVDDPLNVGGNNITVSVVSHQGVAAPTVLAGSNPIADGGHIDFEVVRPAPGSVPGRVKYGATMTGRVEDFDMLDVPAAESLVPTLDVIPTETTTTKEFAFTSNGAVDYREDGGAWSSAGSSPLVIARNATGGATKDVQIRATKDGQAIALPFSVPPQVASPPSRAFTGIGAFVLDYSLNQIEVDWTVVGFVAGDYFRLMRQRNGGGYSQVDTGITATFYDDGTIIDDLEPSPASGPDVTFDYQVEWYDASNALQTTSTVATVVSDTQ